MVLEDRLAEVLDNIALTARRSGRPSNAVQLVAVSKTFGADTIRLAINAGQRIFGENRVQEAQSKWPDLKRETAGIELHLIGPLQSNKAADAVELFEQFQS